MAILPAPYDKLPLPLQETLRKSHIEAEKGWKGLTLEGYLQDREKAGILNVIKAVYDRCLRYPVIWAHIDCIIGGWTYEGGHNISQGFNFRCSKPDDLLARMRDKGSPFCEDTSNVHGPRDTFRELIQQGPGLHVCVTQKASRLTELHDIHIDRFQMVCTKEENGKCNYEYISSKDAFGNAVGHFKDVIPWYLGEKFKEAAENARKHDENMPPGLQ